MWKMLLPKKSLIYEVQGKHYYIGGNVLQECGENEIGTYRKLKDELSRLSLMYEDLSSLTLRDVNILSDLYEKIIYACNKVDFDAELSNDKQAFFQFVSSLTPTAISEIETQISDYTTIENLCDGCFYRESKEFKQLKEEKQ